MSALADDPALVEAVAREMCEIEAIYKPDDVDDQQPAWKWHRRGARAILRALQPHHDRIVREAQREAWDRGWVSGVEDDPRAGNPYTGDAP